MRGIDFPCSRFILKLFIGGDEEDGAPLGVGEMAAKTQVVGGGGEDRVGGDGGSGVVGGVFETGEDGVEGGG